MLSHELTEEHDTPWDDLVLVGNYPTLNQAQDHGLVILAMGEACWVSRSDDSQYYRLHAEHHLAPRIVEELGTYSREELEQRRLANRPPPVDPFNYPAGWEFLLVWMLGLIAIFLLQGQDPGLTQRGASSSIGMIDQHEWWRPFTGLFLHSDVQHLTGNLLGGAVFGILVSRSLGPLRGWLLILVCGTLGNLLTAWTRHPEAFLSIGASTAVFGALGILTGLGFSISRRQGTGKSWARTAAPVMAGFVLLGWLGGGAPGSNTDVLGHAFGFGSGLACGFLTGELRSIERPAGDPSATRA